MLPLGRLEVVLVNANGLSGSDLLSKMDPYVILTCRSQEQKSSVASNGGSTPEWNETFVFTVYGDVPPELYLKIWDKDTFSADDLIGEVKIPLGGVFDAGKLAATSYNVVKDGQNMGELKVGLTFTPETSHLGHVH